MVDGLRGGQTAVIERRCVRCGYQSDNSAFFRKERPDLLAQGKLYCLACEPPPAYEARKPVKPPFGTILVIIFAWIGLAALVPLPTAFFSLSATQALPLVGGFFLAVMISVPNHELGHAAFAHFANADVDVIQIGSGPVLKSFCWNETRIELRLFFFKRGQVFLRPRPGASTTGGEALFILGGPIANASVLAVAALLVSVSDSSSLAVAAYGALFPLAANFLGNLVPDHNNDGRDLVDLLLRKKAITTARAEATVADELAQEVYALACAGRHADAIHHAQTALRAHAHAVVAPYLLGLLLDSLTKVEEGRVVIECYLAHRDRLPPEEMVAADHLAWINVNAAWGAVLTGDPALLPLADELSRKALAAFPNGGATMGVRGAVLIERGDHEKGISFLAQGLRGLEGQENDRPKFVAFWAKGERDCGNVAMADELTRYQHYLLERAAHQAPSQPSAA